MPCRCSNASALLIKIPLTLLLMNENYAILGAPIATVISYGAAYLLSSYLYQKRCPFENAKPKGEGVLALSTVAIFVLAKGICGVLFGKALTVASSVLSIAICVLVYFVGIVFWCLLHNEKGRKLSEGS